MNREIKFRGKRVDNGEWVYGFYHCLYSSHNHCIDDYSGNTYQVIPETVGQFTGLLDKNGKEIYEFDIVRRLDGSVYKIVYSERDAAFVLCGSKPIYLITNSLEIIGNIHDNPELIK